jgi:cytosine deaminase
MTEAIPSVPSFVLTNARIAPALVEGATLKAASDGLASCDIVLRDGRVAAIVASGDDTEIAGRTAHTELPQIDVGSGLVLPRFVDGHTHLDKGHILHRAPNPDGTFLGARTTVAADREARWTASDVRARMDFALRCAFAHGSAAIRTHIDSLGPQTAISWPVFDEMRSAWKGRIELQAAALCPTELAVDDAEQFDRIVETAARYGGSIGGLTFMGSRPGEKLDRALDIVCAAARANGLGLDFHVDESNSPDALTLEAVARAVIRNRFSGRVIAGHCCSLALLPDEDRRRIVGLLGEAGIAVVSLPQVNMYLQDREAGRTPRWRGVVPVHELAAAGVPVMVASDNTRDPFHAYGDLDFLEVFREATRILHLDHTQRDWTGLLGAVPSAAMGFETPGKLRVGGPADLVITGARDLWELCTRPWSDRVVLVAGHRIDSKPPAFRELDRL